MATCMDLWIHCMLCGSEWRSPTQIQPKTETTKELIAEKTIKREEEKEPGERDLLSPLHKP